MPSIKFNDEEFEHIGLLLSAEIKAKQDYVTMVRSVISHFKSVPKRGIKTSQSLELPATAIINKPSKRRGRPPKNKGAEPSAAVAHSGSQSKGVQMLRLEDDFIARTAQVDPNSRKKKRRRRSNYRRKGINLEYLGKPMSKDPIFKG